MKLSPYKRGLIAKERELVERMKKAGVSAREATDEPVRDLGDESVMDELKEVHFMEADPDWQVLRQVREALERIERGTFGKCLVDGEPIEGKRLKVVPWTPYCLKHQQLSEEMSASHTPTL
jgi:DnaK suppressor protein